MASTLVDDPKPKVFLGRNDSIHFQWDDKKAETAGVASMSPPRYIIDLSKPPRRRYDDLCRDFYTQVQALPELFDDVVTQLQLGSPAVIRRLAKIFLRRVHSSDETEELRGISANTGIPMYLMVAFNVLLDLFMGCTSGAVRTCAGDDALDACDSVKMLHFRTLDWGMDPLRKVVVQMDYIRSAGGPIVASAITYAGFVGLLTGVRQDLSVSLNFRPNHDASTRMANFRFYLNHVLVLLGRRPSISSLLRQCVLDPKQSNYDLDTLAAKFPSIITTAAYLTFCDGKRGLVLEKDRASAVTIASDEFVVATNHDAIEDELKELGKSKVAPVQLVGMEGLVEDSLLRKKTICKLRLMGQADGAMTGASRTVTQADVISWLQVYPIVNEETHYASVMDAEAGKIIWVRRYLYPIKPMQGR